MTHSTAVALRQKQRPPEMRAEALRLAGEHGAAQASRLTGIPAATIRSWRQRAGQSGPPAGVDPAAWRERKETAARGAWDAAEAALAKVHELLNAGKTADAQRAALTMAITLDKSLLLEAAAQSTSVEDAKDAQRYAREITQIMETFVSCLGLPWTPPIKRLLADVLRSWHDGPDQLDEARVGAARLEARRGLLGDAELGR